MCVCVCVHELWLSLSSSLSTAAVAATIPSSHLFNNVVNAIRLCIFLTLFSSLNIFRTFCAPSFHLLHFHSNQNCYATASLWVFFPCLSLLSFMNLFWILNFVGVDIYVLFIKASHSLRLTKVRAFMSKWRLWYPISILGSILLSMYRRYGEDTHTHTHWIMECYGKKNEHFFHLCSPLFGSKWRCDYRKRVKSPHKLKHRHWRRSTHSWTQTDTHTFHTPTHRWWSTKKILLIVGSFDEHFIDFHHFLVSSFAVTSSFVSSFLFFSSVNDDAPNINFHSFESAFERRLENTSGAQYCELQTKHRPNLIYFNENINFFSISNSIEMKKKLICVAD